MDEKLVLIDLIKWMEGFANKEALYGKMDSDDFVSLRAFIAENFDDPDAVLNSIPYESVEVLKAYRKAIHDKASQSQALINFMTRNEISRIPYIPGSSIKGAIRTAIANQFVKEAGVTSKNKKKTFEPDYNEKIFGRPTDDPMKNLKVADISLDRFGSVIYEAKEHSSKKDETPKGTFEAAVSLCHTGEPVVYPLPLSLKPFRLKGKMVDPQFVIDALYQFYVPKFKTEYTKFYSASESRNIQQSIASMCAEVTGLRSNETLIRVGHFSHVECVTLDGVRDPQTRKGKDGRRLPWGMTRTLANGVYPFGWAKLEFADLKSVPRPKADWPFSLEKLRTHTKEKEIAGTKAKEVAQVAAKRAQEAEEKRLAAEKREAELAAMSPEERELAAFEDSGITDEQVNILFSRLDEFSDENKPRLARSLKDYWMANRNWTKKDVGQKQWKKIRERNQKIDGILGDV